MDTDRVRRRRGLYGGHITFPELAQTSWSNSAHLQPVESGETAVYEWAGGSIVGLNYTDTLRLRYTTVASQYGTRVFDGNAMSELKLRALDYPRRLS